MASDTVITNKGRIAWIDNIRFFAMLCVILYHSSALVINEYYYAGWIIESFNMALFFFLSGLISYHSIENIKTFKDWFDFFKKKFTRIMLPCLFVSLLVFQKPCAFWFLLTLFYYLIAFASFHYLCSLMNIRKEWAFVFFLTLVFINMPVIGNNQEFIIIFATGLYLSKKGIIYRMSKVPMKQLFWVAIAGFVVWLMLLPFYKSFYLNKFYDLLNSHTLYLFGARQIMAFSFAIASCLLFALCFNKRTRVSTWGGQL